MRTMGRAIWIADVLICARDNYQTSKGDPHETNKSKLSERASRNPSTTYAWYVFEDAILGFFLHSRRQKGGKII